MIKLTIIKSNPERYLYGASQIDNPNTVSSWSVKNEITIGTESIYYCFAKNKITGKISRYVKYVSCDTSCHMVIGELKIISKICKMTIGELKMIGKGFMLDTELPELFTGTSNILIQLPVPHIFGSVSDTKIRQIDNIANGIQCYSDSQILINGSTFNADKPFHVSINSELLSSNSFDYFKICATLSTGNTEYARVYGKLKKSTADGNTLVISNNYQTGLEGDSSYVIDDINYWYGAEYNEFWKQMTVAIVPNQNRVTVTTDLRGWGSGTGILSFKVDVGPEWYTKSELEAIDFSNMKGRDISIFGVLRDSSSNQIMDTKQVIVHFKGDYQTNLPTFFKRNPNKRIGSPSYFPDFNLPSSKLNINNYGSLTDDFQYENHLYLTKGYNLVTKKGNPLIPSTKLMHSDYDRWLWTDPTTNADTSFPRTDGGTNNQAAGVSWVASQSMPYLLRLFQPVISAASGHAVIFYDLEQLGYELLNNQTACDKIATLWRELQRLNPSIKQTSYINAKPIECSYGEGISLSEMQTENNKYNLNKSQLAKGFFNKNVSYLNLTTSTDTYLSGETGLFGDLMGIGIAGDYLHRYNESSFYSFIQEMELAKKHFPDLTMLSLWWSYLETLPNGSTVDINTVRRYYKKTNGFWYMTDFKVAVPFSEFFNRLLAAVYFINGTWIWHDPNNAVNNFDYHGGNGKDVRQGTPIEPVSKWTGYPYLGDNVPNQFVSLESVGQMEISTTVGHDWGQLALYLASTSGDLIEEEIFNTPYSLDGGSNYISGEKLKPASCEYYRTPIVRAKKHHSSNYWLIFAHNKFLKSHETQTIKVLIESINKTIDITLNGKFSTLERITLQ
jgi:hypothetical protein